MSKSYDLNELPKSNVAVATSDNEFGEAVTVDDLNTLPLDDATKEIIREGRIAFEMKEVDDLPSVWRFDGICRMLRRGLPPETILGVLLDESFAIGQRGNGQQINEKAARRDIAKAVAQAANDIENEFKTPIDPKW